jgi:PAS domain S-box-containing protein
MVASLKYHWRRVGRQGKLTIRMQLIIMVVGIMLVAGIVGVPVGHAINHANSTIEQTTSARVPLMVLFSETETSLLNMFSSMRGYLLLGDRNLRISYRDAEKTFEQNLQALESQSHLFNYQNQQRLGQLKQSFAEWKTLPETLFELRENQIDREPAYRWVYTEGVTHMVDINTSLDEMINIQLKRPPSAENMALIKTMTDLQLSLATTFAGIRGYVMTANPNLRYYEYHINLTKNDTTWEELSKKQTLLTPEQQKAYAIIAENRQKLFDSIPEKVFVPMESDEWRKDLYLFKTEIWPLTETMQQVLYDIQQDQEDVFKKNLHSVQQDFHNVQNQATRWGVFGLCLFIGMAYWLYRSIALPLHRLTEAATWIQSGNLDMQVAVKTNNEIGKFADTFNSMTRRLKETMTAHERMQEELHENFHFLKTLVDTIPNPVFYRDIENHYQLCNDAFAEHILGMPKAQVERLSFNDILHVLPPDTVALHHETDQHLLNQPGTRQYEAPIFCADKVKRDFLFYKSTLTKSEGKPAGIVGVMLDITERRQLEEMLEQRVAQRTAELEAVNYTLREEIEHRKEIEHRLRISETHYRTLIETSPDAIVLFDHTQSILFCNQEMARMHGYTTTEEICSKTILDLIAPEEHEEAQSNAVRIQSNSRVKNFERTLLRRDGSRFPAEISTSMVSEGDGHGPTFVSIARDVTVRKEAEQALRESENRFRTLVKTAPIAILIEHDQQIAYMNPAAETILGYTWDELQTISHSDIIHPDSHELVKSHLSMCQHTSNHVGQYEIKIRTGDGIERWLSVTLTNIEYNSTLSLLVIASDITSQKRLEQERKAAYDQLAAAHRDVQRNRDLLHTIFEGVKDGLALIDQHGNVLAANQAMSRLFQQEVSDMLNQSWHNLCQAFAPGLATDDGEFSSAWAMRMLEDGYPRSRREYSWVLGDTNRMIDMQVLPVVYQSKTSSDERGVEHILLHMADVTEERKIEALSVENARLLANRELSMTVVHEITTPLQNLGTLLEMLPDESEEQQVRSLGVAQDEIDRITMVLRQLQEVYNLSPDMYGVVNINHLIERILVLTRGRLKKNRIRVHYSLMPELPPVSGCENQLNQVILNLISNAIEYMSGGGTLRIQTYVGTCDANQAELEYLEHCNGQPLLISAPSPAVVVEVADTGPGIDPRTQRHIFEPFFTTRQHGSGLGLFVSRNILTQHRGSINVESTPGVGTTFLLKLPVRKEENQ